MAAAARIFKTMLNILISFLRPTYTPPTFDPWQPVNVPKSSAKAGPGVWIENEETNTWAFAHGKAKAPSGEVSPDLTPYDTALIVERKFNLELARQMKPLYAQGKTAPEMAAACRCSPDLAKKIRGTFTAALSNEKLDASK